MTASMPLQGLGHDVVPEGAMDINDESGEMTGGGLLPQHGGVSGEGVGVSNDLAPGHALWPPARGENPVGGEASDGNYY